MTTPPIQPSLFDRQGPAPRPYPLDPGFKACGASKAAARVTRQRKVEADRQQILRFLEHGGPHNADEICQALGFDVLYGRPRVSELHKLGLIEKMKECRPSSRGMPAHLMKIILQPKP